MFSTTSFVRSTSSPHRYTAETDSQSYHTSSRLVSVTVLLAISRRRRSSLSRFFWHPPLHSGLIYFFLAHIALPTLKRGSFQNGRLFSRSVFAGKTHLV